MPGAPVPDPGDPRPGETDVGVASPRTPGVSASGLGESSVSESGPSSTSAAGSGPVASRHDNPGVRINGRFLVQPQSGVQRFALETTRALARRAQRLSQPPPVVLAPPGRLAAASDADGTDLVRTGRRGGQAWEQLDLPGAVGGFTLVNLANTAPLRLRHQIVVIHDAGVFRRPEAYSRAFRTWYKLLQPLLVRRGATLVSVSEFSRQEVAACLRVDPARIGLVSEAGDHLTRLVPDRSILDRSGLQPGRFVLAVGNLAVHKNLPALGETARMLAGRGLVLAITGGLDRGVFGQAPAGLPEPAIHVGRVDDAALAALYEAAKCFVFPSTYEGFGIPALEAMGLGCPVVAADIPALREVCAEAAAYCDPYDPAAIARVVAHLVDDAAACAELRERGRARAAGFSWDRTADQLAMIAAHVTISRQAKDVSDNK